ncbi:MAG: alpha/beta fold hydrolase [Proteobacteria bacterium]|nr:alpha/beta fold hydrolase [Pseudomonadota bacterium]
MTEFVRTPDENFRALANFNYLPQYHAWQDLRMHYVDEGPRDGPVMLLMHGMPTWGFLYRDMIPLLVSAGFRCIAPDHMGFGRSDKPTDIHWYTIARHTEILTTLITALDLKRITLVCQDWGGPTGLAQAALMPERFERLIIMNTWLHHPEFEYSEAIRNWNRNWHEGGIFCRETPNVGLLLPFSAGLISREQMFPFMVSGTTPDLTGQVRDMYEGFAAPFKGLPDAAYNGARRFPLSIPVDSYDNGNGAAQTAHFRTLLSWKKACHFIWGCKDDVFTEAWGRTWAAQMNATFDGVIDAGHFLQNSHGVEVAEHILRRVGSAGR